MPTPIGPTVSCRIKPISIADQGWSMKIPERLLTGSLLVDETGLLLLLGQLLVLPAHNIFMKNLVSVLVRRLKKEEMYFREVDRIRINLQMTSQN
jgi:hypothetical protein